MTTRTVPAIVGPQSDVASAVEQRIREHIVALARRVDRCTGMFAASAQAQIDFGRDVLRWFEEAKQ